MSDDKAFDFWYAVNNTEVVVMPKRHLETFGSTVIDYRLLSEHMDSANQIRIREGRIQAHRPEILTPQSFMENALEGFGEEQAEAYLQWLRDHEQDLLILKYGFKIRKQVTSEHIVTDRMEAVVERVKAELSAHDRPHDALLVGVDEPWEVCLLKLVVEMVQQSAPGHAQSLRQDPLGHRHEIEAAFRAAARQRERIADLSALLQRHRLFREYEDRFYALVRASRQP